MSSLLLALAIAPQPLGAASDNPIASAIEAKRLELEGVTPLPAVIAVDLPAGESQGISIQSNDWGWTPLTEVDPWWGSSTLELHGHPNGTTILPSGGPGFGQSLSIFPSDDWDGRVHFFDLIVYASAGNALFAGASGTTPNPLRDVRFTGCQFLDHPDPEIRCFQPISLYQTSIHFEGCVWDLPNSREHAVYNRNPFGDQKFKWFIVESKENS